MVSWYASQYALVVIDWLAWANDQTEGILEYGLLILVVAPALIVLIMYLGGGSSGDDGGDE